MSPEFRSTCPISSALDIIGDKWTLLIIRDMLFFHKKTFKDFSGSEEGISSNILSSRLKLLEDLNIIKKSKQKGNQKSNIYILTKKGISLMPVIAEITLWSDENIRELHPLMMKGEYQNLRRNKQAFLDAIKQGYLKSIATNTEKNSDE